MTQWILVLMIYGGTPPNMAITSVSGFLTYAACAESGEAWKHTKQELDREYYCLPAQAKIAD